LQATLCMLSDAKELAFREKKKNMNLAGMTRLLNCGDEALLYKHFLKNVFNAKKLEGLSQDDV